MVRHTTNDEPTDEVPTKARLPDPDEDVVVVEAGDTVQIQAGETRIVAEFERKRGHTKNKSHGMTTAHTATFTTDDGRASVEWAEEYEPSTRDYPGYHGFTPPMVHAPVLDEPRTVDSIKRVETDGGRDMVGPLPEPTGSTQDAVDAAVERDFDAAVDAHPSPEHECGVCGARYYGKAVAETCEVMHAAVPGYV